MGKIFLPFVLFAFINANSQVNDSLLKIMEEQRLSGEAFSGKLAGRLLPDFTAKDLNGRIYTSNIIRNGKVTFLNLWYLSCTPCIAEMPNLNRLYDRTKSDPNSQFYAITWEPEARVKEAIEKYGIRFPVLLASHKDTWQLTFARGGYPANMVLDKNGRVYTYLSGGSLNPGPEFEFYWKQQLEKVGSGDTAVAYQIPKIIPGAHFIETSKIQSLAALAEYFKGQSMYIDIWALGWMPYREELKTKNNLIDFFLNKHKIVRLYLSINNPQAERIWKDLVYEYQMAGYHLLAGKELFNDIKQRIYKGGPTIDGPRHIIIRNGEIVELNAFSPGDGEKLIKQLTKNLF